MAREIPLGKDRVAIVDDEDFDRVSGIRWYRNSGGYAFCRARRYAPSVLMHRFILNPPEDMVVDHINGDILDNRRSNLRVCTQRENVKNQRRGVGNTSGFKGVSAKGGRFRAVIVVDGQWKSLGTYPSAIRAACVYDQAARDLHGEFASLNFSPDRDWLLPYPEAEGSRLYDKAIKRLGEDAE